MAIFSAGILLYRRISHPHPSPSGEEGSFQVFLAHPGGPFWAAKDEGVWTIPKGLVEEEEDELACAIREFEEETSIRLDGPFAGLGTIKQKSGKVVHAWACEGDADPRAVKSNTVKVVWPPKSGQWITVPEVDRCEWFDPETAMRKINPAQAELILRLAQKLS